MQIKKLTFLIALAGLTSTAYATDGYFSHGYGMKAIGMGGAATTSTDDAFFGANNPAAAAFVGNRLDLGLDVFSPRREASNSSFGGGPAVSSTSNSNYFLIPELGYNHMMSNDLALGVTVYGNGGMNTDYPDLGSAYGNTNLLGGTGKLGVDLMQLIVAPTAAYKVAPNHSLGISPLIGYQRFKADGLQAFDGAAPLGGSLNPNQGYDDSFGYGVRVGYLGKITPAVTIGAAYASRMNFQDFKKYRALFAEQGGFDIPENFNLGVSWQASSAIRLALDYQRINYSQVKSVGNATLPNFYTDGLGTNNGAGFGWDDVNVWKLGMEYKYNSALTLRAGYNHTDNPIKGSSDPACSGMSPPVGGNCGEVTFNILAPAVIKDHVTLGFTYAFASGDELTMAYMHAFKNDVSGVRPPPFNNMSAGSTDKIQMYEDSLGIQYSWKM
jgi:long-chain fatty acid transport protein